MNIRDRFTNLPINEQYRLWNLVKFMRNGNEVTKSTLAGFSEEAIELLKDIVKEEE